MSPAALLAMLAVVDPQASSTQSSQPTASAKPAAAPSTDAVSGVTVVGGKQAVQTSIDRRSYDVSRDLNATSGSVADALRSVPSVEVSPQGDVTIRGAGVRILVDGKESGAYKGAGAGQALQSLPASQIERVEVMTNPTAEFTPEGGGGIINLITKKNRQSGLSGSVRANVGDGHENGGVNLNYKAGKLSLNGGFSVRHDQQRIDSSSQEKFFTTTGAPQSSTKDQGTLSSRDDSENFNLNGDYDLDAKTRISSGYYHGSAKALTSGSVGHIEADASGATLENTARLSDQKFGFAYDDVDFTIQRQLSGDDSHKISLSLDYDIFTTPNRRVENEFALGSGAPVAFVDTPTRGRQAQGQLDLKYDRPMPGKSMLKVGYSLRQIDDRSQSSGLTGLSPALGLPDPAQTDTFTFSETVHAIYVTYERPIGKLTVLPGLRLEDATHDLEDATSGQRATADDLSLYPSLHLAYTLNDAQTLNFSYSHRINRASAQDLNPFVQILDSTHLRQGNPRLHQEDTNSFEGGWQWRKENKLVLATLFRRDTTGGFADAVSTLPSDVLLTTRANIGESHSTGVELSASGKLFKTLSYNLSANAAYMQLYTPGLGLGFDGRVQGAAVGGKASLSWEATAKDLLQADLSVNPKRFTPQGYNEPTAQLNLGFRHKLNDAWAFNVTATDAANSERFHYVFNTPQLQRVSIAELNARAVYIGFVYTFGQGAPHAPAFDFTGGGGRAP